MKSQIAFSEKIEKGFSNGLSYSTSQKSKEARGKAIAHPHAVPCHS